MKFTFGRTIRPHCIALVIASVICPVVAMAQASDSNIPTATKRATGETITRYHANQTTFSPPKFEFAEDGQTVMVKRTPYFPEISVCQFQRFSYKENKLGVEHIQKGDKLKREADEILSEEQKAILREWGQPDYLRGPYDSTRGDSVVEWAYLSQNHLFQFVNRTMVYHGALTDLERTAITYGAPDD